MAAADRAEVSLEVLPFVFKRETRIPRIHLTRPQLRLESGPDGTGNWVFGDTSGESRMTFGDLRIDRGNAEGCRVGDTLWFCAGTRGREK